MALTPQFGSLIPSQTQQLLASNYLQFNTGAAPVNDFAQQFLPEIYEQEVERYGNRTLSGFLKMVGAEMPMTSDQVIWSEQNRLHISYGSVGIGANGAGANVITVGANVTSVVSINDTVVLMNGNTGAERKCIVTASAPGVGGTFTVIPFVGGAGLINIGGTSLVPAVVAAGASNVKVFVYGSAYAKGTNLVAGGTVAAGTAPRVSVTPQLTQFSNSPIIIRDQYTISGSDMAQIGWIEVSGEAGQEMREPCGLHFWKEQHGRYRRKTKVTVHKDGLHEHAGGTYQGVRTKHLEKGPRLDAGYTGSNR